MCSTRSPARGRRSSRRSSRGTTRSASTSPRSTACSCASRPSGYDLFLLETELRDALSRRGRARRRPSGFVREWYAPRAASELLHFRDLARRVRACGRAAGRPRPRRALRAPDEPLRPRLPARADDGAVLVPQAPAHLHTGRGSRQVHLALPARHARADQGVPPRPGPVACGSTSSTATRARSSSTGASTRSSPRRRIPVSSTTTSSTATRTSSSGSTTAATVSSARP